MCVDSSATVCLPSSYVHKSMATRHCGLPVLESRSFLFLLTVKKKLLQPRLQVLFLTWSFLSRIVINIYILLYFSEIKMLLYTRCVCFLLKFFCNLL